MSPAMVIRLILLLVSLSFLLSSPAIGETSIGVILPMSGDFQRYGERIRVGLERAAASGLKLIFEDEQCNSKSAVAAYSKLRSIDKVRIFIGPWCGSPQTAIASLLERNKDDFAILGSSAPRRVFELSGGRMFSVQASIEEEAQFNAQKAYELGAKKVVILFLENEFSRAHEVAFRQSFRGEVIETLTYSTSDGSSLRALATKIKQLNPDALYVPDALPLMHGLLKYLESLGMRGIKVFSVYSAQSADVLAAVGSAGNGIYFSYPKIEGDAFDYFPALAAKVLQEGLKTCPHGEAKCIVSRIKERYSFDEFGVLRGELGLKTISDGKFHWAP